MSQVGGANVFVLDEQNTVQIRPVRTGGMRGNMWQIVEGLQAGERVITNGTNMLEPGMKVAPRQDAPAEVAAQ